MAAGLLFFGCVVHPLARRRQANAEEMDRLNEAQRSAAQARAVLVGLRGSLRELDERREAVRRRIPAQAGEHEFLSNLSQAAQQAGLELVDYRREGVVSRDSCSALHIVVKCRGSHSALCDVLHYLHHARRLTTIERMTITSDLASGQHTIEMTVALHYGLHVAAAEDRDV